MDPLVKKLALARKEREIDENNNAKPSDESRMPQDMSRQKRRLLDIAWKMYDITSEMFYLKSDVADLISKVDSLEASGMKDGYTERGRVGVKPEEELIANKEIYNVGSKGFLAQRREQSYEGKKCGSIFGMDDLSFLLFKEIVGEITAECVGKIIAGDNELDSRRFKDLREIRKSRERRDQMEVDNDFREGKEERPIFGRYDSEPQINSTEGTEDTPTTWRYRRHRREENKERDIPKYSSFSLEERHEEDRKLQKPDSITTKKSVSFRRNDSNIEDGLPPDDPFFSRLNDSLYFHRSHFPEQSSRYKHKYNSSSGKMSPPAVSSDGSDFL